MATWHIPPFVGCDVPADYPFAVRVMWYAIWIKAWPCSSIHFRFESLDKSFISERPNF